MTGPLPPQRSDSLCDDGSYNTYNFQLNAHVFDFLSILILMQLYPHLTPLIITSNASHIKLHNIHILPTLTLRLVNYLLSGFLFYLNP